jgi:4-hydroxybenzoate polyprenyltransferase
MTTAGAVAGRQRSKAVRYLSLLRPKQWIKNLFVLAPAVFAREIFHSDAFLTAGRAFLGFCLAASAVYIINDLSDVRSDRAHPVKRYRPLAAGTLSTAEAVGALVVLLILGGVLVATMHPAYTGIVALYFVMNLAYSLKLKDVLLLDVFVVAAGFMLRVFAGAAAIRVPVSSWIVLCTLFISLFLGWAKRRSELVMVREEGLAGERKVLQFYSIAFLDQLLTITAAGAVISYALYTVAPHTVETFGTDNLIYTTIFVLFGIFRFLHLVHTTKATENPTNAVTSDPVILTVVLLWITACVLIIYGASGSGQFLKV